jgi:hypothetical protein
MTSPVKPPEFSSTCRALVRSALASVAVAATLASAAQEPASQASPDMAAFGRLVPLGYISRQVRIPSFADDGKLASVLSAATLVRIDDERLQAADCHIHVSGARPEEDVEVRMSTAIYHMTERTLRSGERSRVTRWDFEMEGDSMVFDTGTSIGRMRGRVRTVIHDTTDASAPAGGEARASANQSLKQ